MEPAESARTEATRTGDFVTRDVGHGIPPTKRDALVIVRISDPDPGPLEVVELYVAEVLTKAGFVVGRVNIEWLT